MASISPLPNSDPEEISFTSCPKCSGEYKVARPNNQAVTIFSGKAPPDKLYKALSYVCGIQSGAYVSSSCQNCLELQKVAIASSQRFNQMMQFVGEENPVFIDVLSINQENEEGIMSELLIMGDTYKHASTVAVFLPAEDEEAYWMLKALAETARKIVYQQHGFGLPLRSQPIFLDAHEDPDTLSATFISLVEQWSSNIKRWKYWNRAWTFQEWAVAAEIEVTFEGAPLNERIIRIKNDISSACTIVCHYQMQLARMRDSTYGPVPTVGDYYIPLSRDPGNLSTLHATLQQKEEDFLARTDLTAPLPYLNSQMVERETTGQIQNTIRALFPFREFLVADSEDDFDVQRQKTYTFSVDSGTYITLPSLKKDDEEMIALRSSLTLALNALGTSEREATFEADLIVCWASMCGIGYEYRKEDLFSVALAKVLSEMRNRGLRVFNWLANTNGGEVDLRFLDYAPSQQQCNATSRGYLFGSPVFVGRVDTCFHLKWALRQDDNITPVVARNDVTLRKMKDSEIHAPVHLTDTSQVLKSFKEIITGTANDTKFTDVLLKIEETLEQAPKEQIDAKQLIVAYIQVEENGVRTKIDSWALVSRQVDIADIFVARESLNGTLILAIRNGSKARIIAYLTMTNQRYGTYLLKSNDKGVLDVVFKRKQKVSIFDSLGLTDLDDDMRKLLAGDELGFSFDDVLDQALNVSIDLNDHLVPVE